jgi:hypothetical protein
MKMQPVFIHPCKVAGVKPAVGLDCLARDLFVAEVALHDDRATHHQLAHLVHRRRPAGVVHVSDTALDIRQRHTDRAVLVRAVGGERGSQSAQLGHSPELDQRATEPVFGLAHLGLGPQIVAPASVLRLLAAALVQLHGVTRLSWSTGANASKT